MRSENYYTMAFDSTHFAVAAEKYFSPHIAVEVMPTLRKITASCGISLRIEEKDIEKLKMLIAENKPLAENSALYHVTGGEIKPETL